MGSTDHPVVVAPAPWTLQADSWVFPFWNSSTQQKSIGLPSGTYHPKETIEEDEEKNGKFKGGPGGWMLYRYSDSPVGPYDEVCQVVFCSTVNGVMAADEYMSLIVDCEKRFR